MCGFVVILLQQLDTGIYFWCFIVYCTTRYRHIFLMRQRVLCN